MTKEEFADAMKPLQEALAELSGKVGKLNGQAGQKPDGEQKPEPEKPADKTAEALAELSGKVEKIAETLNSLTREIPPKTNAATAGTGEADSEDLI
ncbi:MAG: hypothetical protein L6W00_27100 [Lentisphaeria bacterium]|nr:MAG: hypothetical protein L6W00_27100 [Lentisphaeria bacterium]